MSEIAKFVNNGSASITPVRMPGMAAGNRIASFGPASAEPDALTMIALSAAACQR